MDAHMGDDPVDRTQKDTICPEVNEKPLPNGLVAGKAKPGLHLGTLILTRNRKRELIL